MSLTGTVNDATATDSPCGFHETYCGTSYNNRSTHICINCDFSYDDSFLSLESEESEWISDSKSNNGFSSENPSTPLSSNGIIQCVRSEDNISVEHLLEIEDMQEFSADGPLFWPYEGKFSWSFEESGSPFCISPREGLVFGGRSMTPRIKESRNKVHESVCRLTCAQKMNDEKVALKGTKDDNKVLCLDRNLANEDHESNYDLLLVREDFCLDEEEPEISIETLVGLKEFDGREGLDSEFNGDVFMLEESLNNSCTGL
ncbi:hypothetical protein LR48_Vigan08g162700 [Vigna angularis]|uniref:Uncharacterized protein n=2 Tax=Phaseolus angularis TaxID=3914 RepID=A0A0L9V6V5_PHAAN|nr:uncharacterized protein LOC108339820 [Vigna angularis]XP_017432525.1 uncharacterized protein LOC108339820 [Vigna angularis]KAG2397811.1 uncharacterized protein HKW66_Vig0139530 [Vigna angularis]KOM50800.1 hypothetical protein LR48_Vigan08g162700 [Vigna angularis]BAT90824.1 hypothetical protein VIGAN_06211300 [Vigna angularis var. angularis]